MDPNAIYRYQVDAAFPLSDHADYSDLVRYVDLVQPRRVLTLHGFAAEFARDLRERGIEAWALSEENQMEFKLASTSRDVVAGVADRGSGGSGVTDPGYRFGRRDLQANLEGEPSEFAEFARVGQAIGETPAKLEKVRLLSEYLRTLQPDRLRIATTYFTGRAFAQSDLRTLQVGGSIIYRTIMGAARLSDAEFHRIAHSHGDAGKTAFEALESRSNPEPFTIRESHEFFELLHKTRGPIVKTQLLQSRLQRLSASEGEYVVKILTGDLRIGLREGLVEEAIAGAFNASLDAVKEANMLLGDIGATALLASRNELDRAELSIFRPIKSMLASPEPTAQAIWERFNVEAASSRLEQKETRPDAASTLYVEDKFDGIRAQLHRNRERVEIFSRDLKRITDQFPEIADRAQKFTADLIIDGEIVAFEQGRKLTFFDLQKRLGRKTEGADLFAGAAADVPVAFIIFDLLWLNGRSLLKTPLR